MATVTEIEQVRRKIGDSQKSNTEMLNCDGVTTLFDAKYKNLDQVKVFLDGKELIQNKDYTVNEKSGQISFSRAPKAGSALELTYLYSGYLNADIEALVDKYGIQGAVVECLDELLVDSARFYDYSQGQTTDKRSQIFDHLKELLVKAKADAGTSGGEVVFGKRHPESIRQYYLSRDLSRTDDWSDNNG